MHIRSHSFQQHHSTSQKKENTNGLWYSPKESSSVFEDNRPEIQRQRNLQDIANRSSRVQQLKAYHQLANSRQEGLHSAILAANSLPAIQRKEESNSLPQPLRSGIERLSGLSMADVKVHYNSNQPAQFNAHAYAQGNHIHLGSGKEKHLPHEAWHVVQQKQGRVRPTVQLSSQVLINDQEGLEQEATLMGEKAIGLGIRSAYPQTEDPIQRQPQTAVIQMDYDEALKKESEHAVYNRFKNAVGYMKTADSNETRWRNSQAGDAPPGLKSRVEEFKNRMEENRDKFDREFQVLKFWHDRDTGKGKGNIKKSDFSKFEYASANADNPFIKRMLAGAMYSYKGEADRQHERGAGQDNLLLGYRGAVAEDPGNKPKILDTNIWSWGVNQAWIEGGASKKASFTLHTPVGDTVLGYLTYMNGKDFLDAIHPDNFPDDVNILWHNRDNRPTWYALELASLLDMGYRLDSEDQTKMVLEEDEADQVSHNVQNTGVNAYIAGEN